MRLFLRAYAELMRFEFYIRRGDFGALHKVVSECPVVINPPSFFEIEQIVHVLDLASIWYWKTVLCLQRSAATVCLLRACGVPAELVIGAQSMPFKSHAWVELDEKVINDKPYVSEVYAVLDRC